MDTYVVILIENKNAVDIAKNRRVCEKTLSLIHGLGKNKLHYN